MSCSILLTGQFEYVNGEISTTNTTAENPLTYLTRPSSNALEVDNENQ